ncbi:MAG TPA: hypothetical protein PLO33_10815 [Kouleothrix sp.]|nr:hypothetical protein [Kouleothrix sp.]HRC76160.1 hypothetical protein [Kouleothrix sp.]
MAVDAKLVLQASVTKTSTFQSTGVNLPTGTPRRGLKARVIYSAATNASGSNSVTFSIEHSDDNSTYYATASGAADVVNLSTTAQAGEIFIPFETSKPYVRLVATFAGAGSTPTITYQGDITLGRP